MEKSKAKKGLPVFIGVAAVWMGTHFGPGVASGTQLNQYYVRFGLPGIFVTIIAMGFLGYALYCSMEFSRIYKAYDYQSWVVKLFGNKYVVILFDISFLVTILTAASGSMNAVAVLLEDNFGINYWLGVAIIIVCAMLLCAYGAKLVRAASSYMMFIVVGILLVIMVLLAVNGDGDLSGFHRQPGSEPLRRGQRQLARRALERHNLRQLPGHHRRQHRLRRRGHPQPPRVQEGRRHRLPGQHHSAHSPLHDALQLH